MRKIIGSVFVSLDGVIQAPGGPDEDRTGDFELGGWLFEFSDGVVGERVDELLTPPFDLLLGRRTYDIFAAYWPYVTGEGKALGERFDRAAKYVVTGGDQRLDWQNSHRLESIDAIADVKRGEGPDLIIQGSGTLYPQLLRAGLIDRLTLITFPVILGAGKRLFGDGTPSGAMRMVEHQVTPGGNIIATYRPDGAVEIGSYQAEDEIRQLLDQWARATRTGARDRVLVHHEPDVVIYDVLPPMQHIGAEAYRESWDEWQPETEDEVTFDLHDLEISAGRDVAFAHGLIHCGGTTSEGREFEDWVRATFCLRKHGERWLVAHQHISAPRS